MTSRSDQEIVASVRERAGFGYGGKGPTDQLIAEGVRGFAREFAYWYDRVLQEALPKYKALIVDRINPMIRSMELEGMSTAEVADALVGDYARRNYVTAGGWALEQLAIAASPTLDKSGAAGIDAERREGGPAPVTHLYVIKSGLVTRNSDILKALKTHGAEAQKRLLQTNKKAVVRVVYAILAGRRKGTFQDGVHRPSSAEFWDEVFGLEDETQATDLAVAMAQEAGTLLRGSSSPQHLEALREAIGHYICTPGNPDEVDWEFLAQRNMRDSPEIRAEDRRRHNSVKEHLRSKGITWPAPARGKAGKAASALADAAAAVDPETNGELEAMLPDIDEDPQG